MDNALLHSARRYRQFCRFYSRHIGLVDRSLNGTGRSLSEARVLHELVQSDHLTASDLVSRLRIDAGYLSRMLNGFEKEGLLVQKASEQDRRVNHIVLTRQGRATQAVLDGLSQSAAEAILHPLDEPQRQHLIKAMGDIEAILGVQTEAPITLRPHRIGDMGWIVHRQAVLYAEEYGWDDDFEALLSEVAALFLHNFKPERERCWVAEHAGAILGSVFLVQGPQPSLAKLRMLYVEPAARREGLGRRLVAECIAFAREKGYERLELWTQDIQLSARRLFESAGFKLIAESPHHSFGHALVGETWLLHLSAAQQDDPSREITALAWEPRRVYP